MFFHNSLWIYKWIFCSMIRFPNYLSRGSVRNNLSTFIRQGVRLRTHPFQTPLVYVVVVDSFSFSLHGGGHLKPIKLFCHAWFNIVCYEHLISNICFILSYVGSYARALKEKRVEVKVPVFPRKWS